jgi:outer membrane receptor protein involved in Fe transport
LAHYEVANVPEPIGDWFHFYSLTATQNLGFADLTSTSGYFQRHEIQTQDASESISYFYGLYPYTPIAYSELDITRQFSEEVRLGSRGDGALHWVTGMFFSDDRSDWDESSFSQNPAFAAPGIANNTVWNGDWFYRIRQYALFADGSYKFADDWSFSTGVRWYNYNSRIIINGYGAVSPVLEGWYFTDSVSDSGLNPRFNLSYSPNANLNTYISASKGYRPGGPAEGAYPQFCGGGNTPSYKPDSIWDYEIGEKAKFFDNRVTVNSDFYYIKWSGVQETVAVPCGYTFEANAGNGRTFGPEVEINAKLNGNWSVLLNGSYTDAKITHPSSTFIAAVLANPVPGGISGCPNQNNCTIPILNVPKSGGSLTLIYTTKVLDGYQLSARVSDVYVGQQFDQDYQFGIPLPAYNLANARVGLSGDRWNASLFVNNLTNKVAELTTNNTQFQFNVPMLARVSTNQPRTFGTEISYRFGGP